MTNETSQELEQLRAMATPYRFREAANEVQRIVKEGQRGRNEQ